MHNREKLELEIEVRRLQDEVARLKKLLARIYALASQGVVHTPTARRAGRSFGSTKRSEQDFIQELFVTYQQLPAAHRRRDDVALAMGISRRTLHRYLERWAIRWPPDQVETLEDVLARLTAQNAAQQQFRPVNPPRGEDNVLTA